MNRAFWTHWTHRSRFMEVVLPMLPLVGFAAIIPMMLIAWQFDGRVGRDARTSATIGLIAQAVFQAIVVVMLL